MKASEGLQITFWLTKAKSKGLGIVDRKLVTFAVIQLGSPWLPIQGNLDHGHLITWVRSGLSDAVPQPNDIPLCGGC